MAETAGVTAAAAHKATTKTSKPKSPRAYPSFYEMISDAIVTLKEKTGSSQYAITKFVEEKHKKKLPSNFRKLLLVQLKKLVASGKLVKVKNSFKLPSVRPAPAKKPSTEKLKAAKPKPKTGKAAVAKPKPKAKVAAAAKPKPKTAAKAQPATKPKAKAAVKPKTKAKTTAKPTKVARTAAITSPGKKAVKPKKAAPAKSMKKLKSVKSPAGKKKTPAKKAKK